MVGLSSTLQPLGDRGISLIDSYGRKKVLGVEGNSKSVAVFTGDSGLPPGQDYLSAPEVARSAKVHWLVQWLWIPC